MIKSNAPIIEIHGTGIHNRGAELMAIAISEKIWTRYPKAKIVVPSTFGFPTDINRYGFLTSSKLEKFAKRPIFSWSIAYLTGKIVNAKKINVVLDASGFAFSDQWGDYYAKHLYLKVNEKNRVNQKLILLPQALGKFENKDVREWSKKLFSRAETVFARDEQSYKYSEPLINETNKLKLSPDFTIGVKPLKVTNFNFPDNFVAIVPNLRMIDKVENPNEYLNFLKKSIDLIKKNGMTPLFLIHDAKEDLKVVSALGNEYSNYQIIQHEDPRVLKWILGQSQFVIGSRFHALVSAMSQGIPCIGAGWSHKYPELFSDFNNKKGLINDLKDVKKLEELILNFSDLKSHQEQSELIKLSAKSLMVKVDEMWEIVLDEIEKHLPQ